jgi:arylsulfatase A-like enzyme
VAEAAQQELRHPSLQGFAIDTMPVVFHSAKDNISGSAGLLLELAAAGHHTEETARLIMFPVSWWHRLGLLWILFAGFLSIASIHAADAAQSAEENDGRSGLRANALRPNIVWIIVEDMSADFSCYGETVIRTPNIDQLAADGIRFSRAFVTAPICSISRSALITGCYQTSIGAQNHRSSVPGHEIPLPDGIDLVPAILRRSGYHANNLTLEAFLKTDAELQTDSRVDVAKTDYNFIWDESQTYDSTHWASSSDEMPFFVQVQLRGGKLRGNGDSEKWPQQVLRDLGSVTDAAAVQLPPWLPDNPVIRKDWAQYLDAVRYTDWEVARVMQRLRDAKADDNTIIVLMTDHGISHVRTKQFLYDGGIHVPLIVKGAGVPGGVVRDDLVEHIDLAATTLSLAGVPVPKAMHSRDILASGYRPRKYVFAARDRADETVDLIRSVRTDRWKYIANGFPNRPWLQPNRYKDNKPIVMEMRRLFADGKLNAAQSLIMAESRPREELYDTHSDPFELTNLAADPNHVEQLSRMRTALREWQIQTNDPAKPESEDVYRTEVMAKHREAGRQATAEQYLNNVELMLRWMKERPLQKVAPASAEAAPLEGDGK